MQHNATKNQRVNKILESHMILENEKRQTHFAAYIRCVVPGSQPCTGISITIKYSLNSFSFSLSSESVKKWTFKSSNLPLSQLTNGTARISEERKTACQWERDMAETCVASAIKKALRNQTTDKRAWKLKQKRQVTNCPKLKVSWRTLDSNAFMILIQNKLSAQYRIYSETYQGHCPSEQPAV